MQIDVRVKVIVRIAFLYLAEFRIHFAVIVNIVGKQVRADRSVFYRQRSFVKGLVVILDILIQSIAFNAADRHDIRIGIVLIDVVYLEKVIQRFAGNVQIIRAEVPTPFCDHNSPAAVTGLLTEGKHGIVIIVSDVLADIRGRLIVKILIARHDDIVGLVLIPFSLDTLQLSVCIEEPLRNGEIYRVELILIPYSFHRSFGTVKGVLDIKRYRFEIFHGACKRTLSRSVRTVTLRIARKLKSPVDCIFGSVV